MEVNYVFEGLKIMLLGMSTVFTFLVVMIVMMNIMSKIVHRFFPEANDANNTSPAMTNNAKKIAAITAAIMHHRQVK
ncbi:MAG: OadG family protein [Helicobacteraceae bacterium]|jgi:oxaloacetate decarboxylase gamma subunit|nr:OadG family protein [Helicobacteraceae bacterium]